MVVPAQLYCGVQACSDTVHEGKAYEPLSVPLMHVRAREEHVDPGGTEATWYAVTVVP